MVVGVPGAHRSAGPAAQHFAIEVYRLMVWCYRVVQVSEEWSVAQGRLHFRRCATTGTEAAETATARNIVATPGIRARIRAGLLEGGGHSAKAIHRRRVSSAPSCRVTVTAVRADKRRAEKGRGWGYDERRQLKHTGSRGKWNEELPTREALLAPRTKRKESLDVQQKYFPTQWERRQQHGPS
ncbi:hypothetical protein PG990_001583 [Apiospora arundinis]|uniref:Uncharacterized protein n=1 Tax=Apiospora arundinis TaxID=335852 RepID=A0ABR2HRW5_9PEZI